MSRIIITGGNGFIGRYIVEKLLNEGRHSIITLSNTKNSNKGYLEGKLLRENPRLTFHNVDIRDNMTLLDIFIDEKADICIHLAAKISVANSIKNPKETMDVNVDGTLNVLEACYKSHVNNLLFASSAAVYGDLKELPIKETATLAPQSPYGTSKMNAEQHVSSYKNLNKIKRTISLRIFNVYGNGQSSEGDVITQLASKLSRGLAPEIFGDGTQTRDFISVGDVVDSFILSIKLMEDAENSYIGNFTSPLVFNIGTGIPTSINELAIKMIDIFGLDVQPIYKDGKDRRGILYSYADISKAKKILHFNPKKGIETGLREIVGPMLIRK